MTEFTLYHGNAQLEELEKCDELAPSMRHGCQQAPDYPIPAADPWILDNGAFVAYSRGERWDYIKWMECIDNVLRRDVPLPEFIILPDVMTDAEASYRRTARFLPYAKGTGIPIAFAVQDGMTPDTAVPWAAKKDFDVLFIGGSDEFKERHADRFVSKAHEAGMDVHIGRPRDIAWAHSIGADSADTTSIIRNQSWDRLKRVEAQLSGQMELPCGGQTAHD